MSLYTLVAGTKRCELCGCQQCRSPPCPRCASCAALPPQTGSGKTFTIYGNPADPGLTPRGISELFRIIDRDSGKYTFSVSCYMLELYQVSYGSMQARSRNAAGFSAGVEPREACLLWLRA